jgi:hypothetical protein
MDLRGRGKRRITGITDASRSGLVYGYGTGGGRGRRKTIHLPLG